MDVLPILGLLALAAAFMLAFAAGMFTLIERTIGYAQNQPGQHQLGDVPPHAEER